MDILRTQELSRVQLVNAMTVCGIQRMKVLPKLPIGRRPMQRYVKDEQVRAMVVKLWQEMIDELNNQQQRLNKQPHSMVVRDSERPRLKMLMTLLLQKHLMAPSVQLVDPNGAVLAGPESG